MKKVFEKMVTILVKILFEEEVEEPKVQKAKEIYTLSSVYPSKKIMKEIKRTIR